MPSTFARKVMLAAPSVAMAVVGAALFGPGAARSFEAARVSGGPTQDTSWLSFRIAVTRRYRGIDSVVTGKNVEVRATSRDDTVSNRCVTGADGICDVELGLKKRIRGPVDLFVGADGGNEPALASGTVEGTLAQWTQRPPRGPEIVGSRSGNLELRLFALRGVLAAPFPDELQLSVKGPEGEPRAGANVTMSLVGGDVAAGPGGTPAGSAASAVTNELGSTRWIAVPRAHAVEVSVEAKWRDAYGTFAGALPVVPGAIWLDPRSRGPLDIVSPVPRARAYAMFATQAERIWGGTISLENDGTGFAKGTLPWPDEGLPENQPVWLVLSGDPEATGVGTVGWPESPGMEYEPGVPMPERSFADTLLLDGMPAAERRETDRRRHAAWLVAIALAATAGLEAALLLGSARTQTKGAGWGRVVAAVAAVVLAFAAIGIVAMWKAAG